MSRTRAIASNTAIQVAGKSIGTVLGIITVGVMTRHLGQTGYGQFTTVMSFLQFFGILVDFGLTLTMVKMISLPQMDEKKVASNIFTIRLIASVIFFGIAPAVAAFMPYPAVVKIGIALGSLSFLGVTLSQVLIGIFQKHLAMHRAAIAEVGGRAVLLVGAIWAAMSGAELLTFVGVLVVSNAVQLVLVLGLTRRYVPIRISFDLSLWKKIIRESWPIGISIAFNLIYLKGDIVILSITRSAAEVGLYGAAYKILDVITVIPMIFMGLVLPLLTTSWSSGNKKNFSLQLDKAFGFLSILALPLAFGTVLVAKDLMSLVAGQEFASSGLFLAILMVGAAMVFWGALFGHTIVALGLQKKMIIAYAVDAVISIALYFVLIPRFGAVAAAWVTVFSEAFIAVATAVAVMWATGHVPSFKIFNRAFLASALMAAIVFFASPVHVLLRILIGMIAYAGLLILFKGITKEMIALVTKRRITESS